MVKETPRLEPQRWTPIEKDDSGNTEKTDTNPPLEGYQDLRWGIS